MTQQQRQQLDQRLKTWREQHPDTASLRTAYRQQILSLTLNSMALECEPVEATRLQHLLAQPAR
ncbi:MAG: hypothetical protein U0989_00420 [Azonexus sp.]|nr:hypothetical protein [Azonexus sp.]MDZ4313234.1 hypothetical protein [Azonexus sp.]